MAEETAGNQVKSCVLNESDRAPEKGWIVCRSQKRPGRFYDFNTITGQAIWRDPNTIEPHSHAQTALLDQKGNQIEYPEPTENPVTPAFSVKSAPVREYDIPRVTTIPKIYNKQIINNQFPGKTFTIIPPCNQYSILNSNNDFDMSAAPTYVYPWAVPQPTTQVVISPAVAPLNQVPTIFGGLQNLQMQNTTIPLSNRFQVLKQFNDNPPNRLEGRVGFKNSNHILPTNYRNFGNKNVYQPNDLRSRLIGRNRQEQQNDVESDPPAYCAETSKKETVAITEDEINLDDTDKWLEDHTDEKKKLTVDMECIWQLADTKASRDCWYIIPTISVLLNHTTFLSSILISDERARLLAPRDAMRALRLATFSDKDRLAECAKRAIILIRQSSKHSDIVDVEDASDTKSCLELLKQNKLVILLFNEKDKYHQEIGSGVRRFTVNELKQYLSQYPKAKTVSEVAKFCENITITVPNNEAEPDCLLRANANPSPSSQKAGLEKVKDTKILTPTSPPTVPEKKTVNVSVQTDFNFTLSQSAEKCDKEEMKINSVDTNETCNGDILTKAGRRKIRLNRQRITPAVNSTGSDVKTFFKWRKRKNTGPTPNVMSQLENDHKRCSFASSPFSSSTPHPGDCVLSDTALDSKIVDETSTSGVISNSMDSDSMFKVHKHAILNESKAGQKEGILYTITSDFMKERLKTRCDEWVSRFGQIMEEVLTQTLHMDPPFEDSTLPPPWSIQEATACIQRKLKSYRTVDDACDKFALFLFKISDDRGHMKTDISPEDFMQMYSYGVNLINVLQLVLKHEDLQIASNSLSQLLADIRGSNLEESNESMETFLDDEPLDHSANISVTNVCTNDGPGSSPIHVSPLRKDEKIRSCTNSPSKYSLRSSRKQTKKMEEGRPEVMCSRNNDTEYSLFSSLGLKKTEFKPDSSFTRNVFNVAQNRTSSPLIEQTQDFAKVPDNIQDVKESNETKVQGIKVIRNFSRCPEMEKRIKGVCDIATEMDYEPAETHSAEYDGMKENIDFTENEPFGDEPKRNRKKEGNVTLELYVHITTRSIQRYVVNVRKFCEDVYEHLKSAAYWEPECKAAMVEKIAKVGAHLNTVCDRLKCILKREPSESKNKFCSVVEAFGTPGCDVNETLLVEYRATIENYLKHVDLLLTFVSLLTAAMNKK